MDWIDCVIRDLCELPDRSSPEDDPEAIVATDREIRACIVAHTPQMHDGWTLNSAANDVMTERVRQIEVEGWTPEHDDAHSNGDMAQAAACYALGAATDNPDRFVMDQFGTEGTPYEVHSVWPWDRAWHKPTSRRRDLVKAAALILAEIERLDRADADADNEALAARTA